MLPWQRNLAWLAVSPCTQPRIAYRVLRIRCRGFLFCLASRNGREAQLLQIDVSLGWQLGNRLLDIIVSHPLSGLMAIYYKPANEPQLILRRCTETNDYELLARVWEAANAKARALSWIV